MLGQVSTLNAEELLLRCDCHDYHFVTLTWWPDDNPLGDSRDYADVEAYLEVGGSFYSSWKTRFKGAWKVLLGGKHIDYEVILTRDKAVAFRDKLNVFIGD